MYASFIVSLSLESTWDTSITVKSNARIGEVVFTVPDDYDNGQLQTDIQLCKLSNYFKVAPKNGCKLTICDNVSNIRITSLSCSDYVKQAGRVIQTYQHIHVILFYMLWSLLILSLFFTLSVHGF